MPIYEFRCANCGLRFEKLCSLGENGESLKCPDCGTRRPGRVMSTFSSSGVEGGKGAESGCQTCSTRNCSSCGH